MKKILSVFFRLKPSGGDIGKQSGKPRTIKEISDRLRVDAIVYPDNDSISPEEAQAVAHYQAVEDLT